MVILNNYKNVPKIKIWYKSDIFPYEAIRFTKCGWGYAVECLKNGKPMFPYHTCYSITSARNVILKYAKDLTLYEGSERIV